MGRFIDLRGKKFGRLTVLVREQDHIKPSGRKMTVWKCKCECGNTATVLQQALISGTTMSCGCLNSELAKNKIDQMFYNGTEPPRLKSCVANKNNCSGYKGISWEKQTSKWRAQLRFQGKSYSLGRYEKIEDAISARKQAEEELFNPIIEEYEKEIKNAKNTKKKTDI